MEPGEDPFLIFNVPKTAPLDAIKERFRALSLAFHPDKQPFDLAQKTTIYFLKIEEAFRILSSPFRRFVFTHLSFIGIIS